MSFNADHNLKLKCINQWYFPKHFHQYGTTRWGYLLGKISKGCFDELECELLCENFLFQFS